MLVDNPPPPHSAGSWDLADIFHTELFSTAAAPSAAAGSSPMPSLSSPSTSAQSPSSRASTPLSTHLPTPPHASYPSFPDPSSSGGAGPSSSPADPASDSFFSFLDSSAADMGLNMNLKSDPSSLSSDQYEDPFAAFMGGMDMSMSNMYTNPYSSSMGGDASMSYDFAAMGMMNAMGMSAMNTMGINNMMDGGMGYNPPTMMTSPLSATSTTDDTSPGINPQLVDSPVAMEDGGDEGADNAAEDGDDDMDDDTPLSAATSKSKSKGKTSTTTSATKKGKPPTNAKASTSTASKERLTVTIAPVKVGGRGTAQGSRRGTVQSGGVVKKGTSTSAVTGSISTMYSGSVLTPVADKENYTNGKDGSKTTTRGGARRAAALPSPPSSHHEADEDSEEEQPKSQPASNAVPTPIPTAPSALQQPQISPPTRPHGPVLHSSSGLGIVPPTGTNGQRKLTPFSLGIDGLSLSAAFAIPPGTFAAGGSSSLPQRTPTAGEGGAVVKKESSTKAIGGKGKSQKDKDEDEDEDGEELPVDWRPSPEVFAKMTSKEKRQLRNKISARNFRVRRKEYISTLEGDIAERDRLLDAIRTELGSSLSENVALRQEIAALKRTLVDGRGAGGLGTDGMSVNLPPPAPLPEMSAADKLAQAASNAASNVHSHSSALVRPNMQKDLPTSPRLGSTPFWGGVGGAGFGGGVTPVHTTLVPSVNINIAGYNGMPTSVPVPVKVGLGVGLGGLQENMNPLLRGLGGATAAGGHGAGEQRQQQQRREQQQQQQRVEREERERMVGGFEGFADTNMFTMKSLDAYRMHLWGKMAAQYHQHHQQQQMAPQPHQQHHAQQTHQPLGGLAANLRPSYFTSSTQPSTNGRPPLSNATNSYNYNSSNYGYGYQHMHTPLLAALLSGKHSSSSGSSYAVFKAQHDKGTSAQDKEQAQKASALSQEQREKQQQQQEQAQKAAQAAMLAAVASQTILRKLGQAFWEAFSGSSSSSSGPSSSSTMTGGPVAAKYFDSTASASATRAGAWEARNWDADKVRRVLEGKAVVRVVDVDEVAGPSTSAAPNGAASTTSAAAPTHVAALPRSVKSNVSVGGSVSVPSSPVIAPAVADAGVNSGMGGGCAKESKMKECSKKHGCLDVLEGMRSLRL